MPRAKQKAETGVPSATELDGAGRGDAANPASPHAPRLLLGERHLMFLDEKIARGIETPSDRPDYPNLSPDEKRVCDCIAAGIFLSKSIVQWAVWNALHGPQETRRDSFKGIRKILDGPRTKVVMRA